MGIDAKETEVLSWAVKIADAKERAEAANLAGNTVGAAQWNAEADAARQKLTSLGYGWVAQALSANGPNAAQARVYIQSLRVHLNNYDPGGTPPLTLQAGLASMADSSWSSRLSGLFSGFTGGLGSISSGARAEATAWLPVVQAGVKILLPVLALYALWKTFRVRANIGR